MEDGSDAAVIAASLAEPVQFGAIFDRHATVLHRYLVRRLGPDDADTMVGEVFRIAFEKRDTYDLDRVDGAAVAVRHRHQPAGQAPAPRGAPDPRHGPAGRRSACHPST